ncbi:MAG: hypothetical protein WCF67_13765 [Chitinophagaceae bacterium]
MSSEKKQPDNAAPQNTEAIPPAELPIKDMEVHHHAHTPRKRFKHYLFEFFMLFLAVTLGFLVENQREHMIEHNREKQYIRSLVEDLKMDTMNLNSSIAYWTSLGKIIDSLHSYAKPPVKKQNLPSLYMLAAAMLNFDNFIYSDRTIEQLRHSGNFRLIREKSISDSLIQYDGFIRSQLREQEKFQLNMFANIMSLQHELFDSEVLRDTRTIGDHVIDSVGFNAKYRITPLLNNDDKLFKYSNELFLYQVGTMLISRAEQKLQQRATMLIKMMQDKYDLK